MQVKMIAAVVSLVTMVGAAYAAGTSVAENLLRAHRKDAGAVWEQSQPRDRTFSAELFGQSETATQDLAGAGGSEKTSPDSAVSFAPEVQVAASEPADLAAPSVAPTPAIESPELRSLMSGGGGEGEGHFFRSRDGRESEYDHRAYYADGDDHEDHERRFGIFEGLRSFEDD